MISLFFPKITAEEPRSNCAKRHKDGKFPGYIFDISKLVGSKLTRFRVCLSSLEYTGVTRLKGLVVEMYRMKRLLN